MNLWLFNKNNQLVISDGFTNSLKNQDIELNFLQSLKFFGTSVEELKNILSLGTSEIRSDLPILLFVYRYQANSLYTFSEITNYSGDLKKNIKNISPFQAQSQIMPEDEKRKLIKLFDDIKLDEKLISDLVIIRKKGATKKWKSIQVLIVDEISMMSKRLFEILDYVAKSIRRNTEVFGGIQLIFSGDFYQLPPVGGEYEDNSKFCFESELWDITFPNIIELTKIYRQTDKQFSKILNQIRIGRVKKSSLKLLQSRIKNFPKSDIKPTMIFPKRKDVDHINHYENVVDLVCPFTDELYIHCNCSVCIHLKTHADDTHDL